MVTVPVAVTNLFVKSEPFAVTLNVPLIGEPVYPTIVPFSSKLNDGRLALKFVHRILAFEGVIVTGTLNSCEIVPVMLG